MGHYLGDPSKPCITVVDTPGTGDTEGRDCDHAVAIANGIKKVGSIEAFLLLFKGTNLRYQECKEIYILQVYDLRFDVAMQEQFQRYESLFGKALYENAVTEFTFW